MVVCIQRCSPAHPLVALAPLAEPGAPYLGAWLWETSHDGLSVDDFEGRPTKAECSKCLDALLELGRVSFLSGSIDDFSGTDFEIIQGVGIETCMRKVPILSAWSLPTLVSTRCRDASPEMFFAFGNWSLGSQVFLLMTDASNPDQGERDFLLNACSGRAPILDLPGLQAWLAPVVDGCGIVAMSATPGVIEALDDVFTSERH